MEETTVYAINGSFKICKMEKLGYNVSIGVYFNGKGDTLFTGVSPADGSDYD